MLFGGHRKFYFYSPSFLFIRHSQFEPLLVAKLITLPIRRAAVVSPDQQPKPAPVKGFELKWGTVVIIGFLIIAYFVAVVRTTSAIWYVPMLGVSNKVETFTQKCIDLTAIQNV